MELASIPNVTGFEAEINAPEMVTLYNREGKPLQIEAKDLAYWLSQGFTLKSLELGPLLSEVTALAQALAAPWAAYVKACQDAGHLDSKAQEVAEHALQLTNQACLDLHLAIHATYAPKGDD